MLPEIEKKDFRKGAQVYLCIHPHNQSIIICCFYPLQFKCLLALSYMGSSNITNKKGVYDFISLLVLVHPCNTLGSLNSVRFNSSKYTLQPS